MSAVGKTIIESLLVFKRQEFFSRQDREIDVKFSFSHHRLTEMESNQTD